MEKTNLGNTYKTEERAWLKKLCHSDYIFILEKVEGNASK